MAMELEAAGGLAAAPLVAREVDGVHMPAHGAHEHATSCANCNATLAGAFCHQCGQHAHVHKSLLHLGEEVLHGILHFDAKGWRTLPMLVARPGQLTRRYIDGQRTRFVSPLALFLFLVFFLFFVASLTGGKSGVNRSGSPEATAQTRAGLVRDVETSQVTLRTAEANRPDKEALAEAKAELFVAENVLKEFDKTGVIASKGGITLGSNKLSVETGWPAVNAAVKHAADNPELTLYKLKSSGAKFSFLLVPISLPFLWLLFFWRRGVTMYDHAVFSLYSLSFMSLMFALVFAIGHAGFGTLAGAVVVCLPPVHMFLQLRGAYALSRGEAFWRTLALLCIAGVVFLLYIGLILMLSVA
ncbi:hypothetical protein CR152_20305 [Massilia violaceinigra]|uniref:DUF3667 domain-containing protein n=1 Tax=Massilia violaceinigra TaxID=2045208 RepID=A0A2D2DNN4_9BURK|nr:DUF3667 domain-containing protein [Massilia violaceinigra]ATQ76596.1 hypothetical protein CR152_20305 [Massilia violaceinigra]